MEPYRLNLPNSSAVTIELLGHHLQFSQDPNSNHLGTTVWDASMVFAKFLEKNCRKGRFCQSKLQGKRVIELGAGCGVAGFALAMLGCEVVATDQKEVLPLLQRNLERNRSYVLQMNPGFSDSFGSIKVAELDWGNKDHIEAVCPPYDFIIGTDVVYSEQLLEPLLHTILALSGSRTTTVLGYEIRSTCVHERMLEMLKREFDFKMVPKSKMDITYQHPSIQLFVMGLKLKPPEGRAAERLIQVSDNKFSGVTKTGCKSGGGEGENNESMNSLDVLDGGTGTVSGSSSICESDCSVVRGENIGDWKVRRYGAMAARLLRDVKIT
ncbi:hypothetical protein Dimus_019533 [Dionaea muscipula]